MSQSAQTVDRKLLDLWSVHDLTPDPAEIEASRRFHIQYWLGLAELAIARDHRQSCYGSLATNIRELLSSVDDPFTAEPEIVASIRHDLAFLEGNVQAYREIIRALRKVLEEYRGPEKPQDCGSAVA